MSGAEALPAAAPQCGLLSGGARALLTWLVHCRGKTHRVRDNSNTQTHTDTHRHAQTHTDTHRHTHTETQIDVPGSLCHVPPQRIHELIPVGVIQLFVLSFFERIFRGMLKKFTN